MVWMMNPSHNLAAMFISFFSIDALMSRHLVVPSNIRAANHFFMFSRVFVLISFGIHHQFALKHARWHWWNHYHISRFFLWQPHSKPTWIQWPLLPLWHQGTIYIVEFSDPMWNVRDIRLSDELELVKYQEAHDFWYSSITSFADNLFFFMMVLNPSMFHLSIYHERGPCTGGAETKTCARVEGEVVSWVLILDGSSGLF